MDNKTKQRLSASAKLKLIRSCCKDEKTKKTFEDKLRKQETQKDRIRLVLSIYLLLKSYGYFEKHTGRRIG